MEKRTYGNTDMTLPILGFGAGMIGDAMMDENYVGYFLNQIVDLGITFIDTARGYGLSEERIGRHLSWRRNDFILSTKVGYGIPGYEDWTYDCVVAGIHRALQQMRTDHIDIVHLHSCPIEILKRGDVIAALQKILQDGLIRFAAFSGENEALEFALRVSTFSGFMSSINVFDQCSIESILSQTAPKGLGYVAKRPIGNAPWLHISIPEGYYCEEYWRRMKAMKIDFDANWLEVALRFTAFTPGITCSIVGTTNLDHIKKNIDIVNKGILPDTIIQQIRNAFIQNETHWSGQL